MFFDEKCVDPARLFYMPRHPKGDTRHKSIMIMGEALDLDKFDRVKMKRGKNGKRTAVGRNPFTDAAGSYGDDEDDAERYVYGDFNLKGWAIKNAGRFEVQDMLEDVIGGDFIREDRGSKPGVHVECPFEAEHSTMGGGGTFVVNASHNQEEGYDSGFTFTCVHAACSGRDRLDFLKGLLEDEWIKTADLENEDYLIQIESDQDTDAQRSSNAPVGEARSSPGDEEGHLRELNEQYAVLVQQDSVSILREPDHPGGQYSLLTERQFNTLERNRIVYRTNDKGAVTKVRMATEWLDWEERRTFKKGLGFYPGGKAPAGEYNTWTGWPTEPKQGDWSLLKHHLLNNVCNGVVAWYQWLITWLADIIQNPQRKTGVAVVLIGRKGSGKSIAFDSVVELFGRYAATVNKPKHVIGDFNAIQADKLVIVADEASFGRDRETEGRLKDLITNHHMVLEKKGQDARKSNNLIRFVILTNDRHAVHATEDERRFFVLHCGEENFKDHKFFKALIKQMNNGGLGAMMYDLMHHEPEDGWDVLYRAPETPYLREQQALTLDTIQQMIVDLVRDRGHESSDGRGVIELQEHRSTEVPLLDMREAFEAKMKHHLPHERTKITYEGIRKAAKLIGARSAMRSEPGALNQRGVLIIPPLREVRELLKTKYGIIIDDHESAD